MEINIINNIIRDIIEKGEGFNQNSYSEELELHKNLTSNTVVTNDLSIKDIVTRYLLGSHELNKLKRVDPNQKIIDAYDIDWEGYNVEFNGVTYSPKTTFEVLDLIFRILKYLYDLHGDSDVVWNDNGITRTEDHRLYWYNGNPDDHNNPEVIDEFTVKEWCVNYNTNN